MNTFFHVAPILLDVGSTILPGNFGRIIKLYNPNSTNFDILTRETIFEQVRQKEFKEKPSRLHCIFLLESLEKAIEYRNRFAQWSIVYEVSVDITNAIIHKGSYTFNIPQQTTLPNGMILTPPNILQNKGYYNGLPELARAYWSTVPTTDIELVVCAAARVIQIHNG